MKKGAVGADLSGDELTHAPKCTQFSREYTLFVYIYITYCLLQPHRD